MIALILLVISFLTSTVGAITGIGGGIILKPVVDATGLLSVERVSFLSGCMVLTMAAVSLLRSRKAGVTAWSGKVVYLALGAAVGGVLGKQVFQWMQSGLTNTDALGVYQNGVLFLITGCAFLYTLGKSAIRTHQLKGIPSAALCGVGLGVLSAFLGIGGGPINLIALSFLFSMDSKEAAVHSLLIIVFSQAASLIMLFATGKVPAFDALHLLAMLSGGVGGALTGTRLARKLSLQGVDTVFLVMLGMIAVLCLVSILRLYPALV